MIKNHSTQPLCDPASAAPIAMLILLLSSASPSWAATPQSTFVWIDQTPVMLAMGDIGPIKNDLAPTDPSANKLWADLTEQQRTVLTPLAGQWDGLRAWQREKMLDIANEYPKMDAQKQQRIQQRLVKWSRMTPYERENARKRYQQFQSLSPEKKEALRKQWKEHQRKAASEGYDPEFDTVSP